MRWALAMFAALVLGLAAALTAIQCGGYDPPVMRGM